MKSRPGGHYDQRTIRQAGLSNEAISRAKASTKSSRGFRRSLQLWELESMRCPSNDRDRDSFS